MNKLDRSTLSMKFYALNSIERYCQIFGQICSVSKFRCTPKY